MLKALAKSSMIICISSVLLLGCATNIEHQRAEIIIERVHSSTVDIIHAYLQTTSEGLMLKGEVKRKRHSHMNIPGHLRVDLIDPTGEVVQTVKLDHSRKGSSDHLANFSILLPITLAEGSAIRISHHDVTSHRDEKPEVLWQIPEDN